MRSRNSSSIMMVERTGGRPITVALPSLVDGEVTIDEAGSVYLVDEVSDGAGSFVRRQTLLLQVTGGRAVDHGQRTDVPGSAVCCSAWPSADS